MSKFNGDQGGPIDRLTTNNLCGCDQHHFRPYPLGVRIFAIRWAEWPFILGKTNDYKNTVIDRDRVVSALPGAFFRHFLEREEAVSRKSYCAGQAFTEELNFSMRELSVS